MNKSETTTYEPSEVENLVRKRKKKKITKAKNTKEKCMVKVSGAQRLLTRFCGFLARLSANHGYNIHLTDRDFIIRSFCMLRRK